MDAAPPYDVHLYTSAFTILVLRVVDKATEEPIKQQTCVSLRKYTARPTLAVKAR